MSENGFYLTLPSNASFDLHPDNTLTHYITTLPQRVSLSGQWECGFGRDSIPSYLVQREKREFVVCNSERFGR